MPIKPENKHLYPSNWKQVRAAILKRANNKCEDCGLRNHSVGYREEGEFVRAAGNIIQDLAGDGLSYPSLQQLSYPEAKEIADSNNEWPIEDEHWIVIVLTIAHLDHNPANCVPENLKALCQKCHNNYDKAYRAETRKQSLKNGQLSLDIDTILREEDIREMREVVSGVSNDFSKNPPVTPFQNNRNKRKILEGEKGVPTFHRSNNQ